MKRLTKIRAMRKDDWPACKTIYLEGIATQNATFEHSLPTWEQWDAGHLPQCRFVAVRNGLVIGWVALSRVSARAVYAGVAEVSVYVAEHARGNGVGRKLITHIIRESERLGIWSLRSSVFPENKGSLALCRAVGFRRVGRFEKVGKLNGHWRDTLLLERRSPVVS
jgi:L-amino acid N-acyltransferase YncA